MCNNVRQIRRATKQTFNSFINRLLSHYQTAFNIFFPTLLKLRFSCYVQLGDHWFFKQKGKNGVQKSIQSNFLKSKRLKRKLDSGQNSNVPRRCKRKLTISNEFFSAANVTIGKICNL